MPRCIARCIERQREDAGLDWGQGGQEAEKGGLLLCREVVPFLSERLHQVCLTAFTGEGNEGSGGSGAKADVAGGVPDVEEVLPNGVPDGEEHPGGTDIREALSGKQEVAVQQGLIVAAGTANGFDEACRPVAGDRIVAATEMPNRQQDHFLPPTVVEARFQERNIIIPVSDVPGGEVFLEGEMAESKVVLLPFHQQPGTLADKLEEQFRHSCEAFLVCPSEQPLKAVHQYPVQGGAVRDEALHPLLVEPEGDGLEEFALGFPLKGCADGTSQFLIRLHPLDLIPVAEQEGSALIIEFDPTLREADAVVVDKGDGAEEERVAGERSDFRVRRHRPAQVSAHLLCAAPLER